MQHLDIWFRNSKYVLSQQLEEERTPAMNLCLLQAKGEGSCACPISAQVSRDEATPGSVPYQRTEQSSGTGLVRPLGSYKSYISELLLLALSVLHKVSYKVMNGLSLIITNKQFYSNFIIKWLMTLHGDNTIQRRYPIPLNSLLK